MLTPLIKTSVRHVHLSKEHIELLFGPDYELKNRRWLSPSKAEFAAEERVTLVGPKGNIERVGIIGPSRKTTQVEVSLSDAKLLGIDVPVRLSGDIENTPGITILGPFGSVILERGVIAARRHVHISMADAEEYGITQHQLVTVSVKTDIRSIVFHDVVCCITMIPTLNTPAMMHIDTDEANAAGIVGQPYGKLLLSNDLP